MVSTGSSTASARTRDRALQSANRHMSIEMPVPVNENVSDIWTSLNSVFVFELCNGFYFGAPLKDPAQGLSYFGNFREIGQPQRRTTISGSELGGGGSFS